MNTLKYLLIVIIINFSILLGSKPQVISVKPRNGATSVSLWKQEMVKIKFDQSMDKKSVINAIHSKPGYPLWPWICDDNIYWKDNKTVIFGSDNLYSPNQSFYPGTEYKFIIDTTARNVNGEQISKNYQWSFNTLSQTINSNNIREIINSYYESHFNLDVSSPAYYFSKADNSSPPFWISTAYINSTLYRMYVLTDGTIATNVQNVKRPQGEVNVIVVGIDYGNTNISEIFNNLWVEAQKEINMYHKNFADTIEYIDKPIVQFKNKNVLVKKSEISNPSSKNGVVNYLKNNGYNLDNYDIIISLDLDAENQSGGYAYKDFVKMGWYYSNTEHGTLDSTKLINIAKACYNHEIGHIWGWEHGWTSDAAKTGPFITPPVLFGWKDTDGDELPEILDTTPYGMESDMVDTNYPVSPNKYSLSNNYPNPFNSTTTIKYSLPKDSKIKMTIYNIHGKLIETLTSAKKKSGYHTVKWDASDVASGLYFYRIEAGSFVKVKKCILVK